MLDIIALVAVFVVLIPIVAFAVVLGLTRRDETAVRMERGERGVPDVRPAASSDPQTPPRIPGEQPGDEAARRVAS